MGPGGRAMSGHPSVAQGSRGPEALATVDEVAAFLRVPAKTLYQWRYLGLGPPAYRVGNHLRFRWRDVEVWLAERGADDRVSPKGPRRNVITPRENAAPDRIRAGTPTVSLGPADEEGTIHPHMQRRFSRRACRNAFPRGPAPSGR
jgi:excisionase family DNA binding protein